MTIILHRMEAKFLTPLPGAFQLIYGLKALVGFLSKEGIKGFKGFTLVELTVVVGIISTLSAFAIPSYHGYIEKARITKAIAEIRTLDKEICAYELTNGKLPDTLEDIGRENLKDPWENPYQYLNFANVSGLGQMRKDRFMVPLNTDYDLYSMGKDGVSQPPLTAKSSYVGKASEY
jgi:general secretion pathway protein G